MPYRLPAFRQSSPTPGQLAELQASVVSSVTPTTTLAGNQNIGQLQTLTLAQTQIPGTMLMIMVADGSQGNIGYNLSLDGQRYAVFNGTVPFVADVANPDIDVRSYWFPWTIAEVLAMVAGFPPRIGQAASTSYRGNTHWLYAGYDTTASGSVNNQTMVITMPVQWASSMYLTAKNFGPASSVSWSVVFVAGAD